MSNNKFDVSKLERLNNPERLKLINLDKIIPNLKLPKSSILVDIGAGTGAFSEEMLNHIPGSTCFSFDISPEMINWIKDNRIPKLNSRLKAELMVENIIPLDNNKADLVFMIAVHHELDDSKELLTDVYRILKENGELLICDWKEGFNNHFVSKKSIIEDIKDSGFIDITEIDASEKFVCILAKKKLSH